MAVTNVADGKAYYTGTGSPGIYLREMDFAKGELTGKTGTSIAVRTARYG